MNNVSSNASFTRAFLLIFCGPIVWAAHFVFVYGFTGMACAHAFAQIEWLGVGIVLWGIATATVAAIAGIALTMFRPVPQGITPDSARLVRWLSVAAGILATLAILWEAMSALIVPACA